MIDVGIGSLGHSSTVFSTFCYIARRWRTIRKTPTTSNEITSRRSLATSGEAARDDGKSIAQVSTPSRDNEGGEGHGVYMGWWESLGSIGEKSDAVSTEHCC